MKFYIGGMIFLILATNFIYLEEAHSKDKKASLKKGKELFTRNLCAECHKNGGNSVRPSKPIKGPKFSKKYKTDEQLVKVIREGVMSASMPSFGVSVISDEEMKDLIYYVRSFSKTPKSTKNKGKKK